MPKMAKPVKNPIKKSSKKEESKKVVKKMKPDPTPIEPPKKSRKVRSILRREQIEDEKAKRRNRVGSDFKWFNRYPWVKWFTSKSFIIRRGKEFKHERWIMAQQIRNKASKMKVKISMHLPENEDSIVVRVVKPYVEKGS